MLPAAVRALPIRSRVALLLRATARGCVLAGLTALPVAAQGPVGNADGRELTLAQLARLPSLDPSGPDIAGQAGESSGIGRKALASFLLPGAGQLLTGREWGWGLIGTEAVLIYSTLHARHEGRQLQDRYETFADAWWDRDRWFDRLNDYAFLTGEQWPYDHHTLPPEGVRDHDYYEMIGKYEQFAPGWEDWTASSDTPWLGLSRRRNDYLRQRADANRQLKFSLTAGGLIFLNHVLAGTEVLLWHRLSQPGGEGGPERARDPGRLPAPSAWGAAGRSLLLPGWGQRTQGRVGWGRTLGWIEAAGWGGMLAFRAAGRWRDEDSRLFAAERAGVLLAGKDRAFFTALELSPDLTTHNAAQLSGLGDPEACYPVGAGWDWRWESEADWRRYRLMRRDARHLKNWATLSLGAVVAGRLVGTVTALIAGIRDQEAGSGATVLSRTNAPRLSLRLEPWFQTGRTTLRGIRLRLHRHP